MKLDLTVPITFNPVSPNDTTILSGDGGGISSKLKKDLDVCIKNENADEIAKIIQRETEKLKLDKAKQIELAGNIFAYIDQASGDKEAGHRLSLEVYGISKKTNVDVFGTKDEVPDIVKNNDTAKTAWEKIMSGAAYDHIEVNKPPIEKDLESARSKADDQKILKIADNQALVDLKEQLMESDMSGTEADEDISKMLRQTKGSNGEPLLKEGESVQIKTESSSSTSSKDKTQELEALRDKLTAKIDKAEIPEEARRILEKSVDDFERLRPCDNDEPEVFYTEQMQKVLDKSDKYKDYSVAATPSLEKITVDGKELIKTTNDKVFVNSDGEFVNSKGKEYKVTDGKITVDGKTIERKEITSKPEISVFMDKDKNTVQDHSLEAGKEYIEDQRLVNIARDDKKVLEELDRQEKVLAEAKKVLPERRKKEEEGKSDNNTLMLIVGLLGAVATVVAALSQGSGKTTTVTGGAACNPQGGVYNPQGGAYGGQGGDPRLSDKYGYNRGYDETVFAARYRSNQYLSTMQFNPYLPPGVTNTPVHRRAEIMRENGTNVIEGRYA
jgi:hypothetical protein